MGGDFFASLGPSDIVLLHIYIFFVIKEPKNRVLFFLRKREFISKSACIFGENEKC